MLHRHRFGILGFLLVAFVAGVCLFVPELLLKAEENGRLGKVQQGENLYYANDVTDESSLDFNFQRRLMMLSGKWMCEKEEAEAISGMIDRENLIKTCSETAAVLYNLMEPGLTDEDRAYISELIAGMIQQWNVEIPAEKPLLDIFNEEIMQLLNKGSAMLYKYTDSILNSYSFYVWEYSFGSLLPGIELKMTVDAVTLDLYSMTFECDYLKDIVSWEDLFNTACYQENMGSVMEEFYKITNIGLPELSPMIFPLITNLYIYIRNTELMQADQNPVIDSEPGYTYATGNYLMHSQAVVMDFNTDVMMLAAEDQTVYACLSYSDSGFKFYFTNDQP